jgi:hypothetical protein
VEQGLLSVPSSSHLFVSSMTQCAEVSRAKKVPTAARTNLTFPPVALSTTHHLDPAFLSSSISHVTLNAIQCLCLTVCQLQPTPELPISGDITPASPTRACSGSTAHGQPTPISAQHWKQPGRRPSDWPGLDPQPTPGERGPSPSHPNRLRGVCTGGNYFPLRRERRGSTLHPG